MKGAGYIRVSTEEQAEFGYSVSEQEERLTEHFKSLGITDVTFYIDDGYSAKDLKRPDLNNLLNDIKVKRYNIVATTKLDRLSRRLFDILSVIDYLEKYNCNYVSANESHIDTSTPAGRLVLQTLGMVAEFERERIAENVRNNMRSIARNNPDKAITRPCYGYDAVNGLFEINLEESLYVHKMAELLLEGKGTRKTAFTLNNLGSRTKEGNLWTSEAVRNLMMRETLTGEIVYNRTYKKGSKIFTRPEEEWIRIPDHHPAILTRETFDALQVILEGSKKLGRRVAEDRYLLSGLVICTHCGAKMNGRTTNKKTYTYYRYACDGYIKKANCFFHWVSRDEIEKLVINRIKKVAKKAPKELQVYESRVKNNADKQILLTKLNKIDYKMQKQIEAYEDELISAEDLKKARIRIEKQREELQREIDKIEESETKHEVSVHTNAKKLINDVLSVDRLKAKNAIRQLIHKIEITNSEDINIIWLV